MAQNFEFLGLWSPSTGTYPIVPHNVNSAYYLVSAAGTVGTHTFAEGDWLIYIEGSGGGSWYRTSGGIIQLASDSLPIQLTSANISDFNEATNAAILVDGVTIVKDPHTGALTVIKGGDAPVITEDDDDSYVAPHKHVSTDVTDWIEAVRVALGPGKKNQPFFSNTAVSNAVVFAFDTKTNTVSADVKIDNATIIKNKYGQLTAGKPQPMNITDILGLQQYLDNYVEQFADPTTQELGATAPNGSAWKPAGAHDFTQVKIGDAFYLLNVDVSNINKDIEDLTTQVASLGLTVQAPALLNTSIIPVLDPVVTFHEAYKSGSGEIVGVTLDRLPLTLPTAKFFKGYTGLSAGSTLEAFIDGTSVGKIDPLDAGIDQTGMISGALVITEDQDSYIDEPAFHNLFKSIRAKIVPKTNLTAGRHTYQIQETLSGVSPAGSGVLTVDVDVPATVMEIQGNVSFSPAPPAHFISGVPSLDASFTYNMFPLIAQGVVGYTYGRNVAKVIGKSTVIDHEGDLPAATIPAAPAPGSYGNATTAPFTFHIMDEYNEDAAISLYPYNSIGTLGPELEIPLGRIDHTVEANRVYSGNPTQQYPDIDTIIGCGAPWDASESLVGASYFGELQKVRKAYQWPNGNYQTCGGPNYVGASGVSVVGQSSTWRWVTLKLASDVVGRVAFTLTFTGGNTASWLADIYKRVTSGILIYAKLGDSGWVDCNKPYKGIGLADTDGAAAMDASGHGGYETTAIVKRVTLGPSEANVAAGDLYVRVALPFGSSKQFGDITVSDWA